MRAIVNLSTEKYWRGQDRLRDQLRWLTTDHVCLFRTEKSVGAPLHQDNSHAFKVYAIEKVRSMGFDEILWLDASIYPVKPLDKIWAIMAQEGGFMENSGNWCANFCHDKCLEYFGYSRDEAMSIMMYSSGVTGINFKTDKGQEFFDMWYKAGVDGIFHTDSGSSDPRFIAHRHDQSCASLACHKLGITIQPGCTYLKYGKPDMDITGTEIIFIADGIV